MQLRYRSPLALPHLPAEGLGGAGASGVWVEPPGATRKLFRYAPEFIDDPAGTGMFRGIGPAVYRSPPVFVSALAGARLAGYRTLIQGDGFGDDEALPDDAAEAAFLDKLDSPDPFLNEQTGLHRDGEGWRLDRGGRAEREIPGTTAVLCSHEPGNYGSFLFRVLPKLVTLRQLGLDRLPVLVSAWPPAFRNLLGLLGVEADRIIQHDLDTVTRLERAVAPSLRNPHAYLDRESAALLQGLADRCAGPLSGRRLYIARLSHGKVSGSTRVLQNEDALAAALGRLNFEVIEPQLLSTEEQIAAFASADMIVGPSGSAMFNVVFARPGTKVVDIESEPDWIYAHTGLFASCQMRYGLFVGEADPADTRPVHRSWTVDIPALMDRISSFIHA
jgi:hypothetical protein